MTIISAQVVIYLKYFNTEGESTYLGSVNAAGEVSAYRNVYGHWITISGVIREKVFVGSRSAGSSGPAGITCYYSFDMLKK